MSDPTWMSEDEPPIGRIGAMGWLRVALRGVILFVLLATCLATLLVLRLVEAPLYGKRRPWTPYITQFVCQSVFVVMGMKLQVRGTPMRDMGAAVANHASWIDIIALNARDRIYFVAKEEVAGWPGIGWLARATGTMFVKRDRAEAVAQTKAMETRLKLGHRLLFFPEGTSTDGQRVLAFKPTLFQSFLAESLRADMQVQPISVSYYAPKGEDHRYYAWWGDTDLAPHLLKALAARRHGKAVVTYHAPVSVADFTNRKALALRLETDVRAGLYDGTTPAP